MSRICSVCGKGKMAGHQVSHSNIKTNKTYSANVQKVAVADENGKVERKYVCTRCMKTAKKAN